MGLCLFHLLYISKLLPHTVILCVRLQRKKFKCSGSNILSFHMGGPHIWVDLIYESHHKVHSCKNGKQCFYRRESMAPKAGKNLPLAGERCWLLLQ